MKRKKASNCVLNYNNVSSPLGSWNVIACELGLHSVKLSDNVTNENFLELGCENVKLLKQTHKKPILEFESWMKQYFSALDTKNFKTPQKAPLICRHVMPLTENSETPYRQKVWMRLKQNVVFGKTISYGDLAKLCSACGKSSAASRAVGGAMANNPISLIVPCHRVVKANGSAGNYSKCTKNTIKLWLLNHERNNFVTQI